MHGAKVVQRSRWKNSNDLSFYHNLLLNSDILQFTWWEGRAEALYLSIEECVLIHHLEWSSTQNIWHMSLKDDERTILRATQFCFKQYISLRTKYHLQIVYLYLTTDNKMPLCNYFKLKQQINFRKFLLVDNLLFFLERVWIAFLLKFVLLQSVDKIKLNTVFQNIQNRVSVLYPTVSV